MLSFAGAPKLDGDEARTKLALIFMMWSSSCDGKRVVSRLTTSRFSRSKESEKGFCSENKSRDRQMITFTPACGLVDWQMVGMCQNRSQYWFIFSHCSTSFHWFNYHCEGAGTYNGTKWQCLVTFRQQKMPTRKKCSPLVHRAKPV